MSELHQAQQPQAPQPTAPPAASRAWLGLAVANLLSVALVLWVGAIYVRLAIHVHGERIVGLGALPSWPFYVASMIVAAGLAAYALAERIRKRPADSRSYRLLPIAAVLFFAGHFLVLPPCIPPYPANAEAAGQLGFMERTFSPPVDGQLPLDPVAFAELLPQLSPPFLRDGERMAAWGLVMRADCDGPATVLPSGVEAGSLLVCVSKDRQTAWLTAVGTRGEYFGPPTLVGDEKAPVSVQLSAQPPEPPTEDAAELPIDDFDEGLEDSPLDE